MKAGDKVYRVCGAIKTLSGFRYGTLSGKDIITVWCHPPIPVRDYDWCAYHEGDEEIAGRYGWGKSEMEALDDMRRLDRERFEEQMAHMDIV